MNKDSNTKTFNKRNYVVVLVLMIVLSVIFWRSLNFNDKTTTVMKVIDILIAAVSVVIVPILFVKIKSLDAFVTRVINVFPDMFKYIKENIKAVLINALIFAGTIPVILGGNWLYDHKVLVHYTNWNRVFTCIAIVFIAGIILKFRKVCYEKAHIVFTIIALTLGLLFINISPAGVGLSWDDQIHYGRTLVISNLFDGALYESDVVQVTWRPASGCFSQDTSQKYKDDMNASFEDRALHDGELVLDVDAVGVFQIAYVPGALGIIFGKGLGLSYTAMFDMGRFFNLLFYTLIIAAGIKRLNKGKILVSFFALTPLLIFTASNYHYDWWTNSLICAGYCYYIAAYQDNANNRIAKEKDMIIAAVMIMLGCIPKAVYCPLLIPLFFIPKNFFNRSRKRYFIALASLTVAILLIFVLPYVLTSAWLTGDQRFGGDVNSGSQISYILHNPLQYLATFWSFIKIFADPANFCVWANFFAYLGLGPFSGIWWSILVVLAFIDRDEKQNRDILMRIVGLIMAFGALALVVTALYVSISEIGSTEIRGVQSRYLFPLLLPFFWYVARPKSTNVSQNKMAVFSFVMATLFFVCTVNYTLIAPY